MSFSKVSMLSTRSLLRLSPRSVHTSTGTDGTRELLRELLRETAQSVVVITALLPGRHPTYHGATLSSFACIALDPHPLVAFSLRIPSRMASALNADLLPPPSPPPPPTHLSPTHFIINVLSAAQPHLADRFARPDVHPRPFEDPLVRYTLSREDLPILSDALGALSCRLVGPSLSLAHLRGLDVIECDEPVRSVSLMGEGEVQQVSGRTELASELFIAKVLRVERVSQLEDEEQDDVGPGLRGLPLLYHRRRYTTVGDHTKS